jgi:hypothetical protein
MRLLASDLLVPLTIHYLEHSCLNSSGPDYRKPEKDAAKSSKRR